MFYFMSFHNKLILDQQRKPKKSRAGFSIYKSANVSPYSQLFAILSLVTKGSVVQKTSFGWILFELLNLCCHLDRNPRFLLDTLAYNDLPYQTVWLQKSHWFRRYIADRIIFQVKSIYFNDPSQHLKTTCKRTMSKVFKLIIINRHSGLIKKKSPWFKLSQQKTSILPPPPSTEYPHAYSSSNLHTCTTIYYHQPHTHTFPDPYTLFKPDQLP